MFGIRLETLPMEASISVSPLALATAGLVSAAAALVTSVTPPGADTDGDDAFSTEDPASASVAIPTAMPIFVKARMALTYFVAGAEDGAGAGLVAGAAGAA